MIVEAYQTLEDRDNLDEIEMDGPFPCSRSDAWLGYGCYFWDSRLDWAIDWGRFAYQYFNKEFVIGRCRINLSKDCFDLFGSVKHQAEFQEIIKTFIESKKIRNKNEALVPNVIMFMIKQGIFPYRSIRAADMRDTKKYYFKDGKEFMVINQRVQICVIDKKDVILRPFNVVYPDKYRE